MEPLVSCVGDVPWYAPCFVIVIVMKTRRPVYTVVYQMPEYNIMILR